MANNMEYHIVIEQISTNKSVEAWTSELPEELEYLLNGE